MRQCYVTIRVTLVAKRNVYHLFIYFVSKYGGDGRTSSKLDKLYIRYSPFIQKLIMNKLVYSLLQRSFNRFFPIRFMTVNVGYFKMLFWSNVINFGKIWALYNYVAGLRLYIPQKFIPSPSKTLNSYMCNPVILKSHLKLYFADFGFVGTVKILWSVTFSQ